MRRLIAYLTLTFTLIFGAALNTLTPLRNLVSNHEYQNGREFVYRISDKENPDHIFAADDMKAINDVAAEMEQRMQNFGVSEYNIAKEGNNIIRATTTLQSDTEYNRLQVYLNYNADFSITVGDDDNTEVLDASMIFDDVKARVEYRGPYPFIIFPLSNPELFQTNIADVASAIQDEKGSADIPEGSDRPELAKEATIVLWTDYDIDKDSYMNPTGDTQQKIFLTFDFRAMWWDEDKTEIGVASPLEGANESGQYSTAQIKTASETARYMANVFNAKPLDYKVEFLFANEYTAPTVEPLINLGSRDNLALSATLFAGLITFALVLIIAFAIYRLPILNALSSGVLTFLGTMVIFNAIQVEFSTSAILGLLVVTFVSLASSIFYAARFRGEVYKGRSFKKAHSEAINRSLIMTVDVLVLLLVTGVFTYFFGGATLAGFATTLIFGSIVMIASVLVHNALLLPLLAHNTLSAKSYTYYGINEAKVPNILNDEKQTYFGRFINHKPEAKAKLNISVMGALSAISFVLVLVFGAFTSINPYNLVKYDENTTRVYFQVSERSEISALSQTNSPLMLLSYIELDDDGTTLADKVIMENGLPVAETPSFTTIEEIGEDEVSVVYNFYVYNLNGIYNGDEDVVFKTTSAGLTQQGKLSDALSEIVLSLDDKAVISFNHINKEAISPHYGRIAWVSLVTLAVTSVYFVFRFGLTRGVANFVESFIGASFIFLFFMVTRLAIPPLATMGAFVTILFISLLNVVIFTNIRDVEKDSAHKGITRREMYMLGLKYSLSVVYVLTLLFSVGFLVFTLIGPLAVSSVYLASLVGVVSGLYIVSKLSTATLSSTLNVLGRIPERQTKRRKESVQRTSIRAKSGEPEEAVFIGIND